MRRDRRPQVQSEEQEQEESEAQESVASTSIRGGALPPPQSSFSASAAPSASDRAFGESEAPELEAHEATHVVQQRRGH